MGQGEHDKTVFAENFGDNRLVVRVRMREFLRIGGKDAQAFGQKCGASWFRFIARYRLLYLKRAWNLINIVRLIRGKPKSPLDNFKNLNV